MFCSGGTRNVPRHMYSKRSLDAVKAALLIGPHSAVTAKHLTLSDVQCLFSSQYLESES